MSFSYFGGQHLIGHAVDLLVVVAPRARAQVRADPVARVRIERERHVQLVGALLQPAHLDQPGCLSPIFIPDQDRPRRPALLTLLFLYTAASYR